MPKDAKFAWEKLQGWWRLYGPRLLENRFALSAVVHGLLLVVMLNAWWFGARGLKRAGSAKGSQVMLNYATGKPSPQPAQSKPRSARHRITPKLTLANAAPVAPAEESAPSAEALGNGPASILFVQAFPTKRPELSGADLQSDVVVDVQIDENGHVVQAHKRRGMGSGVDDVVVATVQQWIFHPAMKDGKAIPSVQELRFHFDQRRSASCGWDCFELLAE